MLPKEVSVVYNHSNNWFMNKTILTLIASAILLSLLVIQKNKINFSSPVGESLMNKRTTKQDVLPNYIEHPNYYNAEVFYTFGGNIDQVKTAEKEIVISSSKSLPIFKISDETKIVFNQTTPASFNDLKPGVKVYITARYDLKSQNWSVPYITVISVEDNPQTGTSSSKLNN